MVYIIEPGEELLVRSRVLTMGVDVPEVGQF
jgi:hypothetical protein